MDARMELMKLQLDQRMLVPILKSTNRISTYSTHFRSYIKTLSLVETPVLQPQENILAKDSKLLRIGLISTNKEKVGGLPNLIKNIFQVSSIRQFTQGMGSTVKAKTIVETGYGFLPTNNPESRYQPVILIHIIGDYRPLISFLVQYVDALIVEHNENDNNFVNFEYDQRFQSLRIPQIMKWKHTIGEVFDEIISFDEPYRMEEFEGSAAAVTSAFQTYLFELALDSSSYLYSKALSSASMTSFRPQLIDLINDKELLTDDDIPILDIKTLFNNVNVAQLKKDQFKLQQSYKKEAKNHLEMDKPTLQLNNDRRKQLEENIREQRNFRSKIYKTIEEIPLLKSYISLISESNDEKRYTQKRHFEFALSEYNEASTAIIRKNKDKLFDKMKEAENNILTVKTNHTDLPSLKQKEKKAIKDYYQVKIDFIETSLVIDHFWREISHLFVVNQTEYQQFPHLAAQHLIDGFSLELLDGDSMLINMQWIEQVLYSLDNKLSEELGRPARILVLSICGPQSSGKSFLLKTMFGTRIRSSVGACTQGVNMMLVKVFHQDYDYIFLLDTEGIRAPEFSTLEDAGKRDNTLASFAVLPADGTILLNKGEINQALEDVLPIVLYLYATSSLSKQLGGQIPSKLFFVYNQIDPSQPQKGIELLQDLITRLQNVTHRIIQAVSSENIPFYGFEQCRLDLKNLSNSDFRILSTNMNNPPINHPVYLFGEQSLYLRQWIDQRITNQTDNRQWKARSIIDMIHYFKIVSDMIRRSPHITSVSTSLEIFENSKLNIEIEKIQHNLSSIYDKIRSQIENETISKYANSSDKSNSAILSQKQFEDIITDAVNNVSQNTINVINEIQEQIFEFIKGTKREVHYREDWERFLQDKIERSKKILAAKIVGELMAFDFEGKTQLNIQQDFIKLCDQINCTNVTQDEQDKIFNDIMKNYTEKIKKDYSFESINVSHEIRTIYNTTAITKDIIIFDQNNICYHNGSSKQLFNDENLLKNIQNDQLENYQDRIFEETKKFNETFGQIKPIIDNLISNANRYEPLIVNTVLIRIQKIINERSIIFTDTIKYVHRETFCYLEYKLIKLQNEWNSFNNRTKRLEDKRDDLELFFQDVVKGIRGIQLFQLAIYNAINTSWHDGFTEYLIQDVATEVTKERWIGNSDILQAKLDKAKIEILKNDGINALLNKISSPNDFYEKCVINFVLIHVKKYVKQIWKNFYDNVMSAVIKAGKNARLSSKDRLNIFLQTLRNYSLPLAIRSKLPLTADVYGNADNQSTDIFDSMAKNLTLAIHSQLPLAADVYCNADNQCTDIFDSMVKNLALAIRSQLSLTADVYGNADNKFRGIFDSMVKNLTLAIRSQLPLTTDVYDNADNKFKDIFDSMVNKLTLAIRSQLPLIADIYSNADNQSIVIFDRMVKSLTLAILKSSESLLKGDESKKILEIIRKHGATDSAKPRCNHACKICGAPCFRHSGHNGHHDFHHQPSGLTGFRSKDTDLIVHRTCHESYVQDYLFSLNGDQGPFHSYTEFPKILDYEVPVSQSQRSLLGEYLMSKYHYQIAEYYKIKPNPPTPIAYDEHTLETIEQHIERRLAGLN